MNARFIDSTILEFAGPAHVRWKGCQLLYFGGCDYLRLSHHPHIHRALRTGLRQFGLNVSSSRLTTGNHPLYATLEHKLERFFGAPAARVVPSGYSSNLIVAQGLAGFFTHVVMDARSHSSLRDASRFLNCPVHTFAHRDPQALCGIARGCGARAKVLVMTDGMFAYNGSVAPLRAYRTFLPKSAWLLVDDAHGVGVVGRSGRGSLEHEQLDFDRIIQTITLSKAFGSYGGAILASPWVQQRILKHSRFFGGSTPIPLPLVCATLAALELFEAKPRLLRSLRAKASYLRARLRTLGLSAPDEPGPIISFAPASKNAEQLRRALLAAGIYPSFLRYPGGPSRGYFRFALCPAHRREDLDRLIQVLTSLPPL